MYNVWFMQCSDYLFGFKGGMALMINHVVKLCKVHIANCSLSYTFLQCTHKVGIAPKVDCVTELCMQSKNR